MLLLDTHVLLWWLDDPASLQTPSRRLIADPRTRVFVSAAVAWEITIKRQLGKLEAPDDLEAALEEERFQHLPITVRHALAVAELPSIHADPFDRIQIAQAGLEGLTIVTRDGTIPRYDVPCLRA
ncbi:MAG: type II toxin-antitoxin system VapC family toxin [Spirochaetaceae bacterium]|nr:type II toxin-antitoxin system VapC family toxin [Spirochaetaceae bacterium]